VLGRGVCGNQPVTLRDAAAARSPHAAQPSCTGPTTTRSPRSKAAIRAAGERNWRARRALYEQLVALDVLADDN
jgi:hypothetical protein